MTAGTRSRDRSGKFCPPDQAFPGLDRQRSAALAHNLVHKGGLTVRAARRVMIEQYDLRRSVGGIASDLREYTCSRCRGVPVGRLAERDRRGRWVSPVPPPPEPEHKPFVVLWGG